MHGANLLNGSRTVDYPPVLAGSGTPQLGVGRYVAFGGESPVYEGRRRSGSPVDDGDAAALELLAVVLGAVLLLDVRAPGDRRGQRPVRNRWATVPDPAVAGVASRRALDAP